MDKINHSKILIGIAAKSDILIELWDLPFFRVFFLRHKSLCVLFAINMITSLDVNGLVDLIGRTWPCPNNKHLLCKCGYKLKEWLYSEVLTGVMVVQGF